MGYTHYWSATSTPVPPEAFGRLALDCTRVIFPGCGVALGDMRGEGEPEITEGVIRFNGSKELNQDYETFELPSTALKEFDFCKTQYRPYDIVVCTVLLRAQHHYGKAIKVESDGDRDDWQPARTLYESLFGTEAP